VKGLAFTNF
jgi:hypothetical protein